MERTLREVLAETKDAELVRGISDLIVRQHGEDFDASQLSLAERVVVLVTMAEGIVGNGGFRYLLEAPVKGDPHLQLMAEALRAVRCFACADAFDRTLEMFPDDKPPANIDKRMRFYLKKTDKLITDRDSQFFEGMKEIVPCQARYIREHAEEYSHLEGPPRERKALAPIEAPAISEHALPFDSLPAWKQVEFATICARKLLPLLDETFPGMLPSRRAKLDAAIDLAEQSVRNRKATGNLRDAETQCVIAAGAALRGAVAPDAGEEVDTPPRNAELGTIASFVAKVAENAVAAAAGKRDPQRTDHALKAWSFAVDAAKSADRKDLLEELKDDFEELLLAEELVSKRRESRRWWLNRASWILLGTGIGFTLNGYRYTGLAVISLAIASGVYEMIQVYKDSKASE